MKCGAAQETITCLAVARALESDVIAAAFAGQNPVFSKWYMGGFTQPGWGGHPNDAVNSGHYSTILSVPGFSPSMIYDRTINQYILAVQSGDSVDFRVSPNVTQWSTAPLAVLTDIASFDRYPSLIGELPDPDIAGPAPWLYFSQVTPADASATWPDSTFTRLQLNVALSP